MLMWNGIDRDRNSASKIKGSRDGTFNKHLIFAVDDSSVRERWSHIGGNVEGKTVLPAGIRGHSFIFRLIFCFVIFEMSRMCMNRADSIEFCNDVANSLCARILNVDGDDHLLSRIIDVLVESHHHREISRSKHERLAIGVAHSSGDSFESIDNSDGLLGFVVELEETSCHKGLDVISDVRLG